MVTNVGKADRLLRLIVGAILIALPFITNLSLWNSTLLRLACQWWELFSPEQPSSRFCPLYRLFGMRTCSS